MYFPIVSSEFKVDEYRRYVNNKLEKLKQSELFQLLKEDVNNLIYWDEICVDECNSTVIEKNYKYNENYLELKELINKLENMEV